VGRWDTGLGGGKNHMNKADQNGSGAAPRRKYDETYKRHAVELTMRGDRSIKAVARELGIAAWALYEWRRHYVPKPGGGIGPVPQTLEQAQEQIVSLRAEVIRMRERETVLKKSLGILSEPPESGMPKSKR
jgi:transposase-like protein